ncbi:MAG: hypothetical protein HC857_07825 [Synechococcales cyanobacterium RU_4_20]|nr:hypothetical protein [Synechococcales cyanobacterium RU_4_20]NJR68505.1 hypothetical protein [Synechococcales cyanobacterium CRU_2_2]
MAKLIAIAGAPGSGKTSWIAQAIESSEEFSQKPALYWPMGGAGVPLDALFLASQCGERLEIISEAEPALVTAALEQGRSVYVEVDNSVDLTQLQFPAGMPLERIGLQLQGWRSQVLEDWSDRLVPSPMISPSLATSSLATPSPTTLPSPPSPTPFAQAQQICAVTLTGQVFDPPSLDVFWQELVGGAYGSVQRAKGIFCLADGSIFYFSFVTGLESTYTRLQVEPCFVGRPQYPSGLESVGHELNGDAILATLQACLLSDELLQQHQEQMKAIAQDDQDDSDPEPATAKTALAS